MNLTSKPRKLASEQEYRNTLFDKVSKHEGFSPKLYVGPRGVPTIGPGIELIVLNNGRYVPRRPKQMNAYLKAAYGRPTQLSDADLQRMNNAANALNQKGLSSKVTRQAVEAAMAGHGIKPLPTGGGRQLFNAAVEEAETGVKDDIRAAAGRAGINPDDAVAAFANSHERQALISLRYNNVQSPKAIAALLQGNRAEAYLEIAYRSNGSKEAGFVARRMAEARDVLGDPKSCTADQKRQWNEVFTRNRVEIEGYEKKFGGLIPPEGYFSHHVKQAGHKLPAGVDVKRISVQSGETIGEISKRTGISEQDLMKAHNLADPKDLMAGSTLVLPTMPPPVKPTPIQTTPGQKGGSLLDGEPVTKDVAQAPKPAKPEITPEQEYMAKAITQEVDPVEHILLKPATVLTEKEVESMIGHDAYWRDGGRHPLGDPLQAKTKEFFESLYPEPQGGRAFTPSEEPRPLAIAYDVPLSYGREVVADDLSNKAANSNIPDAVRGLQTTLNKRGYSNRNQQLPHLKEDGDFGPRTLARLDEELLRAGSTPVLRDLNGLSVG